MPINQPIIPTSVQVINSSISLGSFDEFVTRILDFGRNRSSVYTCCANVHMVVEAYRNPELREILNQADLVTPDGMPLARLIQSRYGIRQERVAGMDLLPALLREAGAQGLKVYFYGDEQAVLDAVKAKVQAEFPGVEIVGMHSPPFRKLTEDEQLATVDRIHESGAQLVFVALGCPKQEAWMARNKGQVHASMIGIGNAFRTYIGLEQRAPKWMQTASLEWLYRLIQNPRRLWKRYVVTNSLFLYLVLTGRTGPPSDP